MKCGYGYVHNKYVYVFDDAYTIYKFKRMILL